MKKQGFKELFQKYKHGLLFLYALIYFPWFSYVESTVTDNFNVIHMSIDDKIPFLEGFVIPYYMWFLYVAIVLVYLFFKDKKTFIRSCIFLFTGMTIFLIVSTVYPNGAYLRPKEFPRDNLCTMLCKHLYKIDTPTNLFPSIHVYNSIGTHISVLYSEKLRKNPFIHIGSLILCILIILSTLFIKQHSMFDIITAFAMAIVLFFISYVVKYKRIKE